MSVNDCISCRRETYTVVIIGMYSIRSSSDIGLQAETLLMFTA